MQWGIAEVAGDLSGVGGDDEGAGEESIERGLSRGTVLGRSGRGALERCRVLQDVRRPCFGRRASQMLSEEGIRMADNASKWG